mmetsp:Transcript_6418/g.8709  ORF Transcript_6418/g.8709 Transcript_6418/m.8709 type:complete len:288 (+) Transcript_6418:63-926(+)
MNLRQLSSFLWVFSCHFPFNCLFLFRQKVNGFSVCKSKDYHIRVCNQHQQRDRLVLKSFQTHNRKNYPFLQTECYNDTFMDLIWIKLFGSKIAQAVKIEKEVHSYSELVEVSKHILSVGNAQEQRNCVKTVLMSLMPPFVRKGFKLFFPDSQWACEINAAITPAFFGWLVGRSSCIAGEVERSNSSKKTWKSTVQIERCRYLEQSQCKGLCTNLCKFPTQDFFTDDLGMPLYMEPNFEDLSCKMVFGQKPLPIDQDPVVQEGCFDQCWMGNAEITKRQCPQIPINGL